MAAGQSRRDQLGASRRRARELGGVLVDARGDIDPGAGVLELRVGEVGETVRAHAGGCFEVVLLVLGSDRWDGLPAQPPAGSRWLQAFWAALAGDWLRRSSKLSTASRSAPEASHGYAGQSGATGQNPRGRNEGCRIEARTESWLARNGIDSAHFVEPARLDVVDEPAYVLFLRDEWALLDPSDRLADVLFEIVKRLGRPLGLDAGLVLDLPSELVVAEGQHPAVGVVDKHDLLGAKKTLRDRERADLVVGDDAARVTDHVGVALLEPEQPIRVQPSVHAGQHRHPLSRRQRQFATVEARRVLLGVAEELVGHAHRIPPYSWVAHKPTKMKRLPSWRLARTCTVPTSPSTNVARVRARTSGPRRPAVDPFLTISSRTVARSVFLLANGSGWREGEAEGESSLGEGLGADGGAVRGGDRPDDGEAEAVPVSMLHAAGVEALEWLEKTLDFAGRDDRSAVAHG